jgi:predicted dehydrogenase
MGKDYAKVLKRLNINFLVIGRNKIKAQTFGQEFGIDVVSGGIKKHVESNPFIPKSAIVAVGIEQLYETSLFLMESGIKNILVEKPGALSIGEAENLFNISKQKSVNLFIGYNRRFYASVIALRNYIQSEGGLMSCNFEFTEWSHEIAGLDLSERIKANWLVANSTHVIDLAFFIAGKPVNLSTYHSGGLDWHPSASRFAGVGRCENEVLFSYSANWDSAGRWALEFMTSENRYVLKPMERLAKIKKGEIEENNVIDVDYSLDEKYKPGLFKQTENFINDNFKYFCSIEEQLENFKLYNQIGNYTSNINN